MQPLFEQASSGNQGSVAGLNLSLNKRKYGDRRMSNDVTDNRVVYQAACHCGTVRFTVTLTDGIRTARRCNCSYCRMRGAVAVSANLDDISVLKGQEALTLYQFHTREAKHYFCSHCGIYTFHQRRSSPNQYGVNVACIAGMSPFDFHKVPVNEGRLHPKDRSGGGTSIAGWLYYETNPSNEIDN